MEENSVFFIDTTTRHGQKIELINGKLVQKKQKKTIVPLIT